MHTEPCSGSSFLFQESEDFLALPCSSAGVQQGLVSILKSLHLLALRTNIICLSFIT